MAQRVAGSSRQKKKKKKGKPGGRCKLTGIRERGGGTLLLQSEITAKVAVKIVLGINLSYNAILQRNAVDKPHTHTQQGPPALHRACSAWEIPQPTAKRFIQVGGEHHVAKKEELCGVSVKWSRLFACPREYIKYDWPSQWCIWQRESLEPSKPQRLCPDKKRDKVRQRSN